MRISLCMITRNEEKCLSKCLNSVKDYVDEIIIVDTGSTDKTCAIAESFAVKLYHYSWEDDFSRARNFGIEKASMEWIIYLDADETLENPSLLKTIINNGGKDIDAYLFKIKNFSNNDHTEFETSTSARMFRNKQEYRFIGRIHEQLPLKSEKIAMTDLILNHYGYTPLITSEKNKIERNISILKKILENDKEDGFNFYNIGNEYVRLNQIDKAIMCYKKALDLINGDIGYESRLYKMLAISLISMQEWDECLQLLNKGINKFSDYPDLYYLKALYYKKLGDYTNAIIFFNKCISMNEQFINKRIYSYEEGITSNKSYYCLGLIYEELNMIEKAINLYIEAILVNTKYKEPFLRIERLLDIENDKTLNAIEKTCISTKIVLAKCSIKRKNFDLCKLIIKSIDNDLLSDIERYNLGVIYYEISDYKKAENIILNSDSPVDTYKLILKNFIDHSNQ